MTIDESTDLDALRVALAALDARVSTLEVDRKALLERDDPIYQERQRQEQWQRDNEPSLKLLRGPVPSVESVPVITPIEEGEQ